MAEATETQTWITGEEFNRERRRLIESGYGSDSAEMASLRQRVRDRNNYIWNTYGPQLMAEHAGKWVAISVTGDFVLGDREVDVIRQAGERFGVGSSCVARLTPDRGTPRLRPRRAG